MHEHGIVAEVSERVQRAGLIPPVMALMGQGGEDGDDPQAESVLIDVSGPVSPELTARLAEVLDGLAYEVRSVSTNHGTSIGGPDYFPTP